MYSLIKDSVTQYWSMIIVPGYNYEWPIIRSSQNVIQAIKPT